MEEEKKVIDVVNKGGFLAKCKCCNKYFLYYKYHDTEEERTIWKEMNDTIIDNITIIDDEFCSSYIDNLGNKCATDGAFPIHKCDDDLYGFLDIVGVFNQDNVDKIIEKYNISAEVHLQLSEDETGFNIYTRKLV